MTPKLGWIKWFVPYMAMAGGNYLLYSMVLPIRIFHHVFISLILIFWFLKYGIPRSHLLWPLLAVWASVVLSIAGAEDKRMALEYAWHWVTNGLLLLMATEWFRQERESELWRAQFLTSGFIAATCVIQGLLYGTRPGGALFNINLAGAYLGASLLPLAVWTIQNGLLKRFGLYGVLLGLVGIAIYLNGSRGAILSVFVALAVFLFLTSSLYKRWTRKVIRLVAVGFPLVVGGAAVLTMSTQPGHAAGDTVRLDLWRVAEALFETHPLGVGPGLFGQAYQALGAGDEFRFTGAHNLYLTIAAELGGPGLASGAVMALAIVYGLLSQKRTLQQNASLAALCGIAAHMMVDNYPSQGFTFLTSLYLAHVLSGWQPNFSFPRRTRYAALAVVAFGAFFMLKYDRAQIAYERSLASGSYFAAQEALLLDPDNRLYQINYLRAAHDGDMQAAYSVDPSLQRSDNLMLYGLTHYGRVFQ